MANFTVTSNANWQDSTFSGRAGNDNYTVNSGATLTIDTDTRYCTNATLTTGNIGALRLDTASGGRLLIDGTSVRLIPYDTGSGNVPAIGTTVSQGGVSSYLLGVWDTLAVAPTAAGAAMPANGFIKVKNKTGGNFAAGALTGIGANATGADVVGWIEVVGVEGTTITINRQGTFEINGEWYAVGTTSGAANQTIQMPASLANTHYPGVWIETSSGSGVYEFYPNAGSLVASTTPTDAVRGKLVWISTQGLLRIGHDGTNTVGYLPASGCNIRVPNVVTLNVTSAAMQTNVAPNATLATRYDFTTTGGGVLDIDKANLAWYPSFSQPYSVSMTNTGVFEQININECATEVILNNVGVGQNAANAQNALLVTSCFAGAQITDCVFTRASLATTTYVNSISNVIGFDFDNVRTQTLINHSSTTTGTWTITNALDSTWTDCTNVGARAFMTTGTNLTWTNTIHANVFSGTTGTTQAQYAFDIGTKSNTITINGLSFGGLTNVQPYLGLVNFSISDHLKIRNIGTPSSRLDLGSANASGLLLNLATPVSDIEVKRVYLSNTRTATFIAGVNSDTGLLLQNVWGDATDTEVGLQTLNTQYKGMYGMSGATPATTFTSVYGNMFWDSFISSTRGRMGMFMNEASSSAPFAGSYTIDTGTPGFNSTGGLVFNSGDQMTFTWPWAVLGYTGFSSTNNEKPTMTGVTTQADLRVTYDIDTGSGYSGTYTKNLFLAKTGGSSTASNATLTMADTTNIAQGDYVWSSTAADLSNGTTVATIENATQITISPAAVGTGSSRTYTFSRLPAETVSATTGFTLRPRFVWQASANTVCTGLHWFNVTDSTSQQTQYPLDYFDVVLSNVVTGSTYEIYSLTDSLQLATGTAAASTVTANIPADIGDVLRIRVRKSSGAPKYQPYETQATITASGAAVYVSQVVDSVAQ